MQDVPNTSGKMMGQLRPSSLAALKDQPDAGRVPLVAGAGPASFRFEACRDLRQGQALGTQRLDAEDRLLLTGQGSVRLPAFAIVGIGCLGTHPRAFELADD